MIWGMDPTGGAGPGRMSPGGGACAPRLSPVDFARRFDASSRTLWYVAAGILGGAEGAEDVLQDAAMIALDRLDRFDARTNFVAWMSRIVRYVALNHRRGRRRRISRSHDPVLLDGNEAPRQGPAVPAVRSDGGIHRDQAEFDDSVVRALDGLSATARACLLLRTVHGLSFSEIALTMSVPEGTAMSHVHRARQQLRASLGAAAEEGRTMS